MSYKTGDVVRTNGEGPFFAGHEYTILSVLGDSLYLGHGDADDEIRIFKEDWIENPAPKELPTPEKSQERIPVGTRVICNDSICENLRGVVIQDDGSDILPYYVELSDKRRWFNPEELTVEEDVKVGDLVLYHGDEGEYRAVVLEDDGTDIFPLFIYLIEGRADGCDSIWVARDDVQLDRLSRPTPLVVGDKVLINDDEDRGCVGWVLALYYDDDTSTAVVGIGEGIMEEKVIPEKSLIFLKRLF